MDRVRIHELGPLHDDLDAGLGHVLVIDTFEAGDLLVLVGDQHVPVEFRARHRPAEAAGILEILDVMAGIDEQLLGDAAADHAGAAEAIFLGDGDLGAMAGGQTAGPHAAGAAADDEEIVVVGTGHDFSFVMAGPDPATHRASVREPWSLLRPQTRALMGGRLKGGHDG